MTTNISSNSPSVRTDTNSIGTTANSTNAKTAETVDITATTAVTSATIEPRTDGIDRTNPPSWIDRTVDCVIDKVKVMTIDDILKEHLVGTDVGPIGIMLSEDIINPDQLTPLQKQTSNEMRAETSKDIVWLKTRVAVHPGISISQSLPGLPASAGFSTDGCLIYEITQPHAIETENYHKLMRDGAKALVEVLKDNSVKLPYKADSAFAMLPGSTWKLTGRGTADLSVDISVGYATTMVSTPVGASANVSTGGSVCKETIYELKGESLDKNYYATTLTEINGMSRSVYLKASVGLTLDSNRFEKQLFDSVPSMRNQKLYEYVMGLTADKVQEFVNRLKISASISSDHEDQDRQIAVSVFDTTNPNAITNYNKGILLNDKELEHAGAEPTRSGVTRITGKSTTDVSSIVGKIEFFNKKLMMKRLVASDNKTTVYAPDGSKAFLRRADFDRNYQGVISGDMATIWNAAHLVETDAQGNIKETPFLLASNRMKDKLTNKKEMSRYKNFAKEFGVDLANAPTFEGRVLFSDRDDTERNYDVVFSQKGLSNIYEKANSTDGVVALTRAYTDASTIIDPDLTKLIKLSEMLAKPSIIEAGRAYYCKVLDAPPSDSTEMQKARDNVGNDFYRAAKNAGVRIKYGNTWDYAEAVGNAVRFSDQVLALTGSADQGEWVAKLNNKLKKQDYENLPEVLSLSWLAGMDEITASVRIKYYDKEYSVAESGAPIHPDTVVDNALDPNTYATRPPFRSHG